MLDSRELEDRVNEARKRGDIRTLLEAARQAMDTLEAAAGSAPDDQNRRPDEDGVSALKAARRIGYNAAADVWPGWEIGTPARTDAELQAAQVLAERSSALTDRVGEGAIARGNAIWLIGAFDLARGKREQAFAAFHEAAGFYANAPLAKLLSEGYMAIAAELFEPDSTNAPFDFASVIDKLDALASDEAKEFRTQLQIARQVFNRP